MARPGEMQSVNQMCLTLQFKITYIASQRSRPVQLYNNKLTMYEIITLDTYSTVHRELSARVV